MELLLPICLKLFPNMLPRQFQSTKDKEEILKNTVKAKIELARFLQHTVALMAKDLKQQGFIYSKILLKKKKRYLFIQKFY
jgi:LETM1 and EF-hand domain-containing protein 1, mitochondrial